MYLEVKCIWQGKKNHPIKEMKPKKRKKQQCIHCSEIVIYNCIKRHYENCQVYAKLIINGIQCSVCSKVFGTWRSVNQHIGHHHKEVISEIKQKINLDLPSKTLAKPGLEISTGQKVSSDLENNRPKNKRKTNEDQTSSGPKNQNSIKENTPPKKQKIVVKEKLDKTELQKLYAALLTDPQNVKKAKEDYFDKLLKNHI